MIVYRITNSLFKDDLSGSGAKTFGGRWNSKGISMLYTSEHISLAVLEMLVNISMEEVKKFYHLLEIYVPDNNSISLIVENKLKPNWHDDESYTNFIGDEFSKNTKALILKVPSSVIIQEHNFLVNPKHPDFKKIKIQSSNPFTFDNRLFIN